MNNRKHSLTKVMIIMLISVVILFALIFCIKIVKGIMLGKKMAAEAPTAVTVTATQVKYSEWTPQLVAIGSVRSTLGVNITTELAGMVKTILFKPGADVEKNTLLVQLNIDTDVAALHSLEANMQLAENTYNRDKAQFAVQAVSKQTLENDLANLKSLQAQVAEQEALIAKKTIRAPFKGRLGISNVNPGQYLNPGDKIVSLQTLDPVYVDFYIPQQSISQLQVGQNTTIASDSFPKKSFNGKITTIDPAIDANTRNIEVEATIENPRFELTPGMFVNVTIVTGKANRFLTLPQSAISFNPYGEIVFIVKEKNKDKNGKSVLTVEQSFVTTGQKRGDQITILSGLKEGDTVVTSGQLKLKNDTVIVINNTVTPENNPNPQPKDE